MLVTEGQRAPEIARAPAAAAAAAAAKLRQEGWILSSHRASLESVRSSKSDRPCKASEELLCFDAAISSCCHARQWQHALRLVEDMQDDGLAPDTGIWDKLLEAMVLSGEMAAAMALCREAKALLGLRPAAQGLDLHGKTVELAKLAVRIALLDVALALQHGQAAKSAELGLTAQGSLSLVVGLGRQSKTGEAILGPAIQQMLSQELGVQSHKDPKNEGCLLIPRHELKSLMCDRHQQIPASFCKVLGTNRTRTHTKQGLPSLFVFLQPWQTQVFAPISPVLAGA